MSPAGALRDRADMDRFRPILCAIDADDHAPNVVAAARTVADAMRCEMRVAHVIAPVGDAGRSDARPRRLVLPPRSATAGAERDAELEQRVAEAEAMMLRLDILHDERIVLEGDAAVEIHALATELDASAVVVGTRGRGSVKSALLGSVSRTLLRCAPCPVMVLPTGADGSLRGDAIVCGVDNDGRQTEAVRAAARLADALRERLVLAHVTQRVDAAAAAAPHASASLAVASPPPADARAARLLRDARRHVHQDLDVTLELRRGRAVVELAHLARGVDAAAIVVATRGSGAVSTALGGSVAQELTTRSHCPVMVVPSAGG